MEKIFLPALTNMSHYIILNSRGYKLDVIVLMDIKDLAWEKNLYLMGSVPMMNIMQDALKFKVQNLFKFPFGHYNHLQSHSINKFSLFIFALKGLKDKISTIKQWWRKIFHLKLASKIIWKYVPQIILMLSIAFLLTILAQLKN